MKYRKRGQDNIPEQLKEWEVKELYEVLMGLLRYEPEERMSAREVVRALEGWDREGKKGKKTRKS